MFAAEDDRFRESWSSWRPSEDDLNNFFGPPDGDDYDERTNYDKYVKKEWDRLKIAFATTFRCVRRMCRGQHFHTMFYERSSTAARVFVFSLPNDRNGADQMKSATRSENDFQICFEKRRCIEFETD